MLLEAPSEEPLPQHAFAALIQPGQVSLVLFSTAPVHARCAITGLCILDIAATVYMERLPMGRSYSE